MNFLYAARQVIAEAEWLIQEWPHSRSHGERWIAFPPVTPADEPWPGLQIFDTEEEARSHTKGT